MEYFLVRIFPHSDRIRRGISYFPAFGLNAESYVFSLNEGKYGPENTPYLDTFHALKVLLSPEKTPDKVKTPNSKFWTPKRIWMFMTYFYWKTKYRWNYSNFIQNCVGKKVILLKKNCNLNKIIPTYHYHKQ